MAHINFLPVLVCGIFAMALGFLWYGPLFGKRWMMVMGTDKLSEEEKVSMRKNAWKLYLTQFVLTLLEMYVLSWYISFADLVSPPIHTAFIIWLAFLVPMIASSAMWNGDSKKIAWNRFLIQAGYQLVLFIICGFILGMWS
ncbi:MAG: DUF1761 domain-containing protein [Candidatus Pacebacteria bacterium]|nr:DUF1761 domain-containing protein [Candidatus Paceibacterota bacterium]